MTKRLIILVIFIGAFANVTFATELDNEIISTNTNYLKANDVHYLYYGLCNDNKVFLREKPSLDAEVIQFLNRNDDFVVLNRTKDKMTISDMNEYWFYIEKGEKRGWVYSYFVDISGNDFDIEIYTDDNENLKYNYLVFIHNDKKIKISTNLLGDINYYYFFEFYLKVCGLWLDSDKLSNYDFIYRFSTEKDFTWGKDQLAFQSMSIDIVDYEKIYFDLWYEGGFANKINKVANYYVLETDYEIPGITPKENFKYKITLPKNNEIIINGYIFSSARYEKLSGPNIENGKYQEVKKIHDEIVANYSEKFQLNQENNEILKTISKTLHLDLGEKNNKLIIDNELALVQYISIESNIEEDLEKENKEIVILKFKEIIDYYRFNSIKSISINKFIRTNPAILESKFGNDNKIVEVEFNNNQWVIYIIKPQENKFKLEAILIDAILP